MGQLLLVSKSSWLAFNSYSPGANAYFLEKAGKLFSLVPGLLNTRGNCVRLFATAWTVACHAPLSMEFSRPEGWSAISSRGFAIPCHFLPRGSSWPRDQTRVCCISYIGRLTPPARHLQSPINICNEASTVPEKPLSIILHSVSPVVEIYQITFVFSHFTETIPTHCILLIQ